MTEVVEIRYRRFPSWLIPTTWFENLGRAKRISTYKLFQGRNAQKPEDFQASCIYMVDGESRVSTAFGASKEEAIHNLNRKIRGLYPKL